MSGLAGGAFSGGGCRENGEQCKLIKVSNRDTWTELTFLEPQMQGIAWSEVERPVKTRCHFDVCWVTILHNTPGIFECSSVQNFGP